MQGASLPKEEGEWEGYMSSGDILTCLRRRGTRLVHIAEAIHSTSVL